MNMFRIFGIRWQLGVFTLMFMLHLEGAILYQEATSGDLSDSSSFPTDLGVLVTGENTVEGVINEGGVSSLPDVFSFTVAAGEVLTALQVELDSVPQAHFLAMQDSGGAFYDTQDFLFAALISSVQGGQNLLAQYTDGGTVAADNNLPQPQGYMLPLGAGDYSLWFQETNGTQVGYTFTLTTQVVPEPTHAMLSALSLLVLVSHRSRRCNMRR